MTADDWPIGRLLDQTLHPKLMIRIPDTEVAADGIGLDSFFRGPTEWPSPGRGRGVLSPRPEPYDLPERATYLFPEFRRIVIRPVADEDPADPPPDAFDDGVGCQRGGKGDQVNLGKVDPIQPSSGHHAIPLRKIVFRGGRLCKGEDLSLAQIDQHGIGIGSTHIDAQPDVLTHSKDSQRKVPKFQCKISSKLSMTEASRPITPDFLPERERP